MALVPYCYLYETPGKKTIMKGVLANGHDIVIMDSGKTSTGVKQFIAMIDSTSKVEKQILEFMEEKEVVSSDDLPF